MGTGFVSVLNSRELLATIYAIKAAPKTIRADLRQQTRAVLGKEWERALDRQPASVQQTRMLVDTARARVSDQSVQLRSASSRRRALSGGATPIDYGRHFEFGSPKSPGKLPRRRAKGYVVYPAFARLAPRALALWVQTTVRVIARALEGDT
jgi:hypothetical protein